MASESAGQQTTSQRLTLKTPLGGNTLIPVALQAQETLSSPFAFRIDALSSDEDIKPDALIGKPVTVTVQSDGGLKRYFSGLVIRLAAGRIDEKRRRHYQLTLAPWLSLLQYRTDCRIFQAQSVPDIVKAVFSQLGFKDFEWRTQGQYPAREYCVQYRESDFAFVTRLLAEEGLFYYFTHTDSKHTLVIGDHNHAYESISGNIDVVGGAHTKAHIHTWSRDWNFVSGKISLTDYNFETPAADLQCQRDTLVKLPNISQFEIYDFPGDYLQKQAGERYSRTRIEQLESGFTLISGEADHPLLMPGTTFQVGVHHDRQEQGGHYVVTSVTHEIEEGSYRAGSGAGSVYRNSFRCAPADTVMRPAFVPEAPRISGTQTALVVGPSNEEIHTDKYGRIKVQFHWDRLGKKDEKSSCWIRVAQAWSGKRWGAQFLPRIGQEVVVSFLEGDPDRPLVIGSVYNAEQMPPYELPKERHQSGFKSRSTLKGGVEDYNEIRLVDDKGKELFLIHAQKDHTREVENDQTESVGHDASMSIGNNESRSVGKNQSESIGGDATLAVSGNQSRTVNGTDSHSIDKDQSVSVGGNSSQTVSGGRSVSVGKDDSLQVSGKRSQSVGDDLQSEVGADFKESVSGNSTHSIGKTFAVSADKVQLTANSEIVIKTGGAEIVLKSSGDITIKGSNINIKGSGSVNIKGSTIKQN
ncbi:type VI secretion system Vgr family protein [Mangrovitalea sediminis]|uniref:type VI secretion system Vgr family protein n=1 Tax=Mangrovitalea sediminis TaxID=1982043 RepID=UPI000BE5496E|nr:type VI secretion system tip protein VgrG [Mangrovitalea sediminis]